MIGIALILLGIAVAAAGYARFRGPWVSYQALKAQDANLAVLVTHSHLPVL